MGPIDINGWEFIVLAILAVFVLGPERLPHYAAKLGRLVRRGRAMAEGARSQLKDQLGPEFDEVDWSQYDPRQYDPRRIVREALATPEPADVKPVSAGGPTVTGTSSDAESRGAPASSAGDRDPTAPTPWDDQAT
jgi:sec-independent protein translocase protein TatB